MSRDTAFRPARTNAKGQAIAIPTGDSVGSRDRLALKRFSWQEPPPPPPSPRENSR